MTEQDKTVNEIILILKKKIHYSFTVIQLRSASQIQLRSASQIQLRSASQI